MTHIKALPKQTPLGTLYASMERDTANGKPINSGSIAMGSHAATATITHEGKKHTVQVIHDMGGSVCLESGGRRFRLNLEALLNHAVENGFLDAKPIDFEQEESK